MADREKLIEAVDELNFFRNCHYNDSSSTEEYKLAQAINDVLPTLAEIISHGVTVRERGQWVGEADGYADGELVYDVWYCSECNYCIDDGTDDPEMLPNFCPNCGADMRGDEDGN